MDSPSNTGPRERKKQIQKARRCRYCLSEGEPLRKIKNSDRIQMLISESYQKRLDELRNASRFVCDNCQNKLEQGYEFVQMSTRAQYLVNQYTYNDGCWPTQSTLLSWDPRTNVRTQSDSSDTDDEEILGHMKRVRIEEFSEKGELGEPSGLAAGHRCDTSYNREDDSEHELDISESSLEKTLSGEISESDLPLGRRSSFSDIEEFHSFLMEWRFDPGRENIPHKR